jgi:phosphatidylglycerophosphatase A
MVNKINFLFVTLFGIGKIKKIQGSFASFATTIFLFFLFHILNFSPNIVLFSIIIIFFISLYAVNIFIKDLTNKDPKEVVIDEFIGQSIPICLYEVTHNMPKEIDQLLTSYLIMFILFRVFDIAKPYPVCYFDKNFKNSFGVIMDDVCAGLYVVVILVLYMVITT